MFSYKFYFICVCHVLFIFIQNKKVERISLKCGDSINFATDCIKRKSQEITTNC